MVTAACGTRLDWKARWPGLPVRKAFDSASRNAWREAGPACMSAFMSSVSISSALTRSTIWSPMAAPMRKFESPARRKRPNGKFWSGKSVAGSLAVATQLVKAGSWVSSVALILIGGFDHAAAQLVALERLEQRLEVAFAEAIVALALDELEEHGTKHRLREDLEQQPL